jgi:RES domain-containing protein
VYTSGSLALAALEILVHIDLDLAPDNFVSFPVVLPDSLVSEKISEPELPGDWQSEYPPVELQAIGAQWIKRKASAVLRVPSTIVPSEHNFLLNPQQADFANIEIGEPRPFHFDRRLW